MDAIPLVREGRLVSADSELEPRVIVEVDVGIEQLDDVVEVLERELVLDGLGEVTLEVEAAPGVVEAAADGILVRAEWRLRARAKAEALTWARASATQRWARRPVGPFGDMLTIGARRVRLVNH